MLIHISYGKDGTSVQIKSQRQLASLVGIAETHIRAELDFLVGANMLHIYPERDLDEILPDTRLWKASPRCQRGLEHTFRLTEKILREDRRCRFAEPGFDDQEQSVRPDSILRKIVAANAREQAGLAVRGEPPLAASPSVLLSAGDRPPQTATQSIVPSKMTTGQVELMSDLRIILGEETWLKWNVWLLQEIAKPEGCLAARKALGNR